jgi:hypothetical protein
LATTAIEQREERTNQAGKLHMQLTLAMHMLLKPVPNRSP